MKLVRVLALAALGLVPSTVAQAQTQATTEASITDGVIYACYVPKTGTVYRINVSGSPTKCGTNHVSFSWNISGPEGPEGPTGPSGLTGYRIVSAEKFVIPQTTEFLGPVCAFDEVILGGGYSASDHPDGNPVKNLTVELNAPLMGIGGNPPGWGTKVANTDPSMTLALRVYAICAKASN